jgi:hypothetical protein
LNVRALLDCGSSHSFICEELLSHDLIVELNSDISCQRVLTLSSATGTCTELCYMLDCSIAIGDWNGAHQFLVTDLKAHYKVILGIDFLKQNQAQLDFFSSTLTLGVFVLHVDIWYLDNNNCLTVIDDSSDSDDQQAITYVFESQVQATYRLPTSPILLKTVVHFDAVLPNIRVSNVATALFDSGSTHSFISPKMLSRNFLDALEQVTENKVKFSITSATGVVDETCSVINVELSVSAWRGSCKFVVSHKAAKHDMVFGIDFLRQECVVIDHGCDSININGTVIQVYSTLLEATKNVRFVKINTQLDDAVICSSNILVKANSQQLIAARCFSEWITTKVMYFEPQKNCIDGCLIGKSLHNRTQDIFVNIMNVTDSDITVSEGVVLGTIGRCIYNNHSLSAQSSMAIQNDYIQVNNKPIAIDTRSDSSTAVSKEEHPNFELIDTKNEGVEVYSMVHVCLQANSVSEIIGEVDNAGLSGDLLLFRGVSDTFVVEDTILQNSNNFTVTLHNSS